MGGLTRAIKDLRRQTPTIDSMLNRRRSSFIPTQPGDPNFSRSVSPGSQLQFPAAASEKDINSVRTQAMNELQRAQAQGIDTSGSEFDKIHQAARQGFIPREPTLGESLLGWVGAPFEFVNLAIQDAISPDRQASLLDYGNALWGGIEDDVEFSERTGFNPRSMSDTLTMFGWAPNDQEGFQPERIARGIVDFGASVLIDPLTYLTGGLAGLGRKSAVSIGRVAGTRTTGNVTNLIKGVRKTHPNVSPEALRVQIGIAAKKADISDWERQLARSHTQTMDEFGVVIKDHIDALARGDLDDEVVEQLARYLGGDATSLVNATPASLKTALDDLVGWFKGGSNPSALVEELALGTRIERELLRPLSQRNFLAINPLALKEIPVWARGGLRIGLPAFNRKLAEIAIEIPGTKGLGKKILGDPIRDISTGLKKLSPKYNKLADNLTSGRLGFDQQRPLLNGLRDGTLKPWQYHIGATAFDNLNNQSVVLNIRRTLAFHKRDLGDAAKAVGEDEDLVWATVLRRLEQNSDEESLVKYIAEQGPGLQGVPKEAGAFQNELAGKMDEAADYMRGVMDEMHSNMSFLDPAFKAKYIDGYVTHSLGDEGRDIVEQFLRRAATLPEAEWADGVARGEPGKALLVRLLNAAGQGGRVETSLGSNRFIDRLLGKLQTQSLIDDGPLYWKVDDITDEVIRGASTPVIGPEGVLTPTKTQYASVTDLNEMLEAAVRGNAEEFGIILPKNWDGGMFKTNPFEIVDDYVTAMDSTIKQWTMIDAMRMAGLVVRHSTAVDVQTVLQSVMANMVRMAKKLPNPNLDVTLRKEILSSPEEFVYHGTSAKSARRILGDNPKEAGLRSGGLTAKRTVAETHAQGDVVLVFRKSDLPPFAQKHIDSGKELAGFPEGIPPAQPIGSYSVTDGLDSLKIPGVAMQTLEDVSVLTGRRGVIDGLPLGVIKIVKNAGMDPTDIGPVRQLYQAVERATKEDFRVMRGEVDDFLPEAIGAGFNITIVDDVPTIQFVTDVSMDATQREALIEAAVDALDASFLGGDLKGRLNHKTMVQLVENAPNDETTDLLHKFYKRKMTGLKDEAREFLGKNPGEFVESTTLYDSFEDGINEIFRDFTAKMTRDEALAQGGRQARQLAPKGGEFDQKIASLQTAARDLKDRGYDEAVEIMREVRNVVGVSDLKDYLPPSRFGLGGPAVEGMIIQRDIGLWLKNVSRNHATIYTPEGVAAAKLATNNLLRVWRTLATLPRPAFHIRNAIGAAWMNMSIGVRGETYRKLGANTLKWRKALREGVEDPFAAIDADIREAWQAMVEQDVLSGFVASESVGRMSLAAKKERMDWFKVWDPDKFVATRVGGRVMESIEDVARASAFLEYYEQGVKGSAEAARDMVYAVHFDYSNLTPMETRLKALIPFFVWTRRNLPRQIEMMVEKPALVQRYKHLMQSMNDNLGGEDNQGLPTGDMFGAYAAGTGFYVNPNTPFWARVMIDPDLPTSDLLTIPNLNPGDMRDFALNLLGPHVTAIVDIGEQQEFNDVNAPAPMNAILKGLSAIGMYNETIDGDVRVPYLARTIQETAFPFTRDLIDPFTGGPTDPNRQQRLGIAEDDNFATASLKNVIASLLRGVGVKLNTPVDVRGTAFRSQEELQDIIRELREIGELSPRDA